MNSALWIVFCLLASMGVVQAVGWLLCTFTKPKKYSRRGYYVQSLPNGHAELESQLRYALQCYQWGGGFHGAYIMLVDNGLDEEGRQICEKLLRNTLGVFIVTPQELSDTIRAFDNLQIEQQKI